MAKRKYIWHAPALGVDFHFFASSLGSWKTSTDLVKLVDDMKREGMAFNLFFIPLPEKAEYQISNYSPAVKGSRFIGFYSIE